jgi:hypothetical protein
LTRRLLWTIGILLLLSTANKRGGAVALDELRQAC